MGLWILQRYAIFFLSLQPQSKLWLAIKFGEVFFLGRKSASYLTELFFCLFDDGGWRGGGGGPVHCKTRSNN